jgi:outer membrane protein TolC
MTLAEALQAAEKRNLTLAAARVEIEKAEAQLSQAYALILPSAEGKLELMQRDHADTFSIGDSMGDLFEGLGMSLPAGASEPTVIMPERDFKGSVQVGMSLVNAQSWYRISAAKKGVALVRLSLEQIRQQLLLGVAQAYFMALMSKELIELHKASIESAGHHLEVAQAKLEAGTGLRIDVIRAETDLDNGRQELLSARLALDNARDAIGVLTGVKGLPMPVEAPSMSSPEGGDEELVRRALARRPDLKVKENTVDLARTQLDGAWMQFLPTLGAGWQLTYQFTKPGDMGSQDRSRWAAMFTLTVPIYNHFRYGDLDAKRAALRQAMIQNEDAATNASKEVREKRRNYLTALASVEIAERSAALTKEALTLAEASYNAGTGSSLDVTDARRTVLSANVNLAAKHLQAEVALLGLLAVIGEDLSTLGGSDASKKK